MYLRKKNHNLHTFWTSKETERASSCKRDSLFPLLVLPFLYQLSLILVLKLFKLSVQLWRRDIFQLGHTQQRWTFSLSLKQKASKSWVISFRIKYMELLSHKHCAWQHLCYLQQAKITPSALQMALPFFFFFHSVFISLLFILHCFISDSWYELSRRKMGTGSLAFMFFIQSHHTIAIRQHCLRNLRAQ